MQAELDEAKAFKEELEKKLRLQFLQKQVRVAAYLVPFQQSKLLKHLQKK